MKQKIKKLFTHNASRVTYYERGGFTLIEIAIVLVVLGMLIALGAALMGPLTKRAKFNESREVVKAAREAIIGYAIERKSLPSSISDTGARNTDAWGHSLESYYYKDANLTGSNLCITTPAYTIATVNDNRTTPVTTLTNKVVVLLLSPGENGTNETYPGFGSTYTIYEYGSGPTNTYDDIVEYIDIAFLREKVCHAFRITTDSLPIGTVETAYPATTLGATDGTTPYAWSTGGNVQGTCPLGSVRIAVGLDIGICLNTTTGVISGTPTTAGSYSFTVQASDSESTPRTTTKSLTITINPNDPVITTEFLNYGTINLAYSAVTLSATGGKSPYTSWSTGQAQGTCAAGSIRLVASDIGICLNTTTGVISGTPTAAGTYSFTVTVTDSGSPPRTTAPKTLSITINPY